jgi:hypothetical protein
MSTKDLDKLHRERMNAVMKAWGGKEDPIAPENVFLSERVVKTLASDKVLVPSYDKQRILASIPFTPAAYVLVCPACIKRDEFEDFQKLVRSGLVIPILLSQYSTYPDKLVEFLQGVDYISSYEYYGYRFARINENSGKGIICQHCAGKMIKTMVGAVKGRNAARDFRSGMGRIAMQLDPLVFPDYTLLEECGAACRNKDLNHLDQLIKLANTVHNVRDAQTFGAPITVDDDALTAIPPNLCDESDEAQRLLADMRKFALDGLGLTFPADIPLDRYIELAKDYQPAISRLIEFTGIKKSAPIVEVSKRILALNAEIERIQGLKRYMVLEASMSMVRQNRGLAFTTVLAGALGLAGHGWLGCGSILANAGVGVVKVLAVVPERPNSRASDFISATTPARAAATMASPDSPTREESPMTLTMRPFLPASRCGAAA